MTQSIGMNEHIIIHEQTNRNKSAYHNNIRTCSMLITRRGVQYIYIYSITISSMIT